MAQVHGNLVVPIFDRDVGGVHARVGSGVVDLDFQCALLGDSFVHRGVQRLGVGDVALLKERLGAGFFRHVVCEIAVVRAADKADLGLLRQKRFRQRGTDAAAAAGDKNVGIFKVVKLGCHRRCPSMIHMLSGTA